MPPLRPASRALAVVVALVTLVAVASAGTTPAAPATPTSPPAPPASPPVRILAVPLVAARSHLFVMWAVLEELAAKGNEVAVSG